MKFYKYYFLSLAFVTVAMTGCKEADIEIRFLCIP